MQSDQPRTAPRGPLSLRRNFAWNLVGSGSYAACQWAVVVVLAKMGDPEMVGRFALGLSIAAPVMMFANLQLRQVQATDAGDEYGFPAYFTVRLAASLLALLVIAALSAAVGKTPGVAWVVAAVGLGKTFESLSDVYHGLFQKHERMDLIAGSLLLKGPLSVAALGAAIHLSGSLLLGALAMAAVWAMVLVAYDIPTAGRLLRSMADSKRQADSPLRCTGDVRVLARLTWQTLPLGVGMCLISLHTNLPRLFLEKSYGQKGLGIFAAISFFMQIGFLVETALSQAAIPRLSRLFLSREYRRFRLLLGWLLLAGAGVGVAGILVSAALGRQILTLVYGPEYALHNSAFVWLMLAAALGYSIGFLRAALTAARRFHVQLPLFVLLAAAGAVSARLLIPPCGIVGAALSIVIARIVLLVGCGLVLGNILRRAAIRAGDEKHAGVA